MKRSVLLMTAAALLGFAACDNGGKKIQLPYSEEIAGTYNGYSTVSFFGAAYDTYDNQSVTITANEDGTVDFSYLVDADDNWGEYVLAGLTVTKSGSTYSISGAGDDAYVGPMSGVGDPSGPYDYTLTGSIVSAADARFTIVLASLMSGTTIAFTAGTAPAPPTNAEAIEGTYSGYSVADAGPAGTTTTPDEQLEITANEDGTVDISFTSLGRWGTYSVEAATVSKDGDDTYSIEGSGTVSIVGMQGGDPSDYDCTVSGTVVSSDDAEITFSVPTVMGLTNTFHTGTPE